MLTKEERNAIAERIGKEFDYTENDEVYEALIGEEIPDNTTWETDCKVVRDRLIELCDTSNMVELPLDKDGEVIRVGDTVYDEAKRKLEVDSIRFYQNYVQVGVIMRGEYNNLTYYTSELTHKSPVTAQELSDYMQAVIDTYSVLIHRPSRTVCLDMVDGSGNGVVSLSDSSIDKLVDSISVRDKPAKTVTVRTRLL